MTTLDSKSIFIQNIPFTLTSDALKEHIAAQVDQVVSAHVPKTYYGKSRGFAIAAFPSHEAAAAAVDAFDGTSIEGRRIRVRFDRPKPKRSASEPTQPENEKPSIQQAVAEGWKIESAAPAAAAAAEGSCDADAALPASSAQSAMTTNNEQPQMQNEAAARQLFIGNLPFSATAQELSDLLRQAGAVVSIDVPQHPFQRRSRGFATALMESAEAASKAISLFNDVDFNGRPLIVRLDRNLVSQNKSKRFAQPAETAADQSSSAQAESEAAVQETESAPEPDAADAQAESNTAAPAAGTAENNQNNRRLYVGNIPFSISWQDLKDLFRTAGDVHHAEIVVGPQGRSRGFGIIIMATPEDAAAAIRDLNNMELEGRMIEVRYDRLAPRPVPPGTQLFVGNLPFNFRWQELKDLFRNNDHNPIHADIPFDPATGRSRGYGTVRFGSPEEAERALDMDGAEAGGRVINVRIDKFNPVV